MLLSTSMPVFAANFEDNNVQNYQVTMNAAETANNMIGLDDYMSYAADETIVFDTPQGQVEEKRKGGVS